MKNSVELHLRVAFWLYLLQHSEFRIPLPHKAQDMLKGLAFISRKNVNRDVLSQPAANAIAATPATCCTAKLVPMAWQTPSPDPRLGQ